MKELQKILEQKRSEGKKEIDGKSAFYLYDTFGFPLELTVELAQEENLTVDEEGFAAAIAAPVGVTYSPGSPIFPSRIPYSITMLVTAGTGTGRIPC